MPQPNINTLTIYKTFVQTHFDYGDIIYEKVYNSSFHQKIESVQYNTCLAITSTIRGTSKEKHYDEFPQYLFKLFPLMYSANTTRNDENISLFKTKRLF